MNYAASRLIELRWDAVVGGSFVGPFLFAGLRGDVQFDVGSIVAVSGGLDLGVSTGDESLAPAVGVHASPLGLRFGEKGEFFLAGRVGAWVGNFDGISLELAGSLSYLFL
jgi:hypothetical protein